MGSARLSYKTTATYVRIRLIFAGEHGRAAWEP